MQKPMIVPVICAVVIAMLILVPSGIAQERKGPGAGPQATQELAVRVSAPRLRFARCSLEGAPRH
jgi:hypothetical protein